MRLIDADKLVVDARLGEDETPYVSKTQIDEAPTVEAIPIGWIKDYVGFGVSDDVFQRNRRFVLNMIKEWEKENE